MSESGGSGVSGSNTEKIRRQEFSTLNLAQTEGFAFQNSGPLSPTRPRHPFGCKFQHAPNGPGHPLQALARVLLGCSGAGVQAPHPAKP